MEVGECTLVKVEQGKAKLAVLACVTSVSANRAGTSLGMSKETDGGRPV
jgi:hypothetical protein